jgi:hypothetical protein
MRLYRCRLDMRACHPAELSTELPWIGVSTPRFRFVSGNRPNLREWVSCASQNLGRSGVLYTSMGDTSPFVLDKF